MKAVLVTAPGAFDWAEIDPPTPGPNEALVQIEVCGICNSTDSELADGTQPYRPAMPFALGHESVGTVLEVGPEVKRYRVGDRVTRVACIMPGETRDGIASGWGGFAELGVVRDAADNYTSLRQVVLPPDVPPETAFMAISLAETRAWLEQVAEEYGSLAGRTVVVLGTGIAGLTLCHWAKEHGAAPVIALGRRDERLLLARRSGADLALRSDDPGLADKVRELSHGKMATMLIEAVGKPAMITALTPLLGAAGVVAVYGAGPKDAYDQAFAALPEGIRWTKPGPEEHRYTRQVAEELGRGAIDPGLWRTHVWVADELHPAFAQVAAGEVVKGCIRIA
jgi:threonine dehydrogenase-like Zn-dependent dehydrogenase